MIEMTPDPTVYGVKVAVALDAPPEIVTGVLTFPALKLVLDNETVTEFPAPICWMAEKFPKLSTWAIETVIGIGRPPPLYADKLTDRVWPIPPGPATTIADGVHKMVAVWLMYPEALAV